MLRGAPLPLPDPAQTTTHGPTGPVVVERAPVVPARPEPLRTVFEFELPRGYIDSSGEVHKRGAMRLATARDDLLPLYDDKVRSNPAYLTVVLLARVITRLGPLEDEEVRSSVV